MPRMIDLIRESAVPASLMRAAAKGALSLPASEMVEILVYLSKHPVFGPQAQLTLAAWDEASALQVAADPNTPPEVLEYLSTPANLRPGLVQALVENPAVPESRIVQLAYTVGENEVRMLLVCRRVRQSRSMLTALASNPKLSSAQSDELQSLLATSEETRVLFAEEDQVLDIDTADYLREHAEEIRAAESEPFYLYGFTAEEQAEVATVRQVQGISVQAAAAKTLGAAVKVERERISPIQKISAMSVGERVQLALKGNKDERFILIRDGARVVSSAVLESPKLTDSEVELFASMKNVHESVLRGIASKRKFIKNYAVIRTLTMNPRCPIEVTLPLLPHLLTVDLRHLSANKNVADTVRKMAWKMYRERISTRRQ